MSPNNRHCAFLIVIALALLAAGPAAADVYQVDRTDDSIHSGCDPFTYPDCSLRGAIIKANNHAGDDIVQLGAYTYTLSIAGADEDFCQTGDLDVHDTLIIDGEGPERTVIDAAGIDRVLHMLAPAAAHRAGRDHHRRQLRVRRAAVGILSSQGGLRSKGAWSPATTRPTGDGGGICDYAYDTTLGVQILDTWVTGNTAHGCGGVHSTSRLLLERSTVSSNASTGSTRGQRVRRQQRALTTAPSPQHAPDLLRAGSRSGRLRSRSAAAPSPATAAHQLAEQRPLRHPPSPTT